jgi:syntaxin 18
MVYMDQTDAFRSLVAEGSKSASSSPASSRPGSRAASRTRQRDEQQNKAKDDGFLTEAYQIVRVSQLTTPPLFTADNPQHGHLADLGRMLKTIRKPYLSTTEPPPLSRRSRTAAAAGDDDELKRFEGTKYLSERERDEIDVRAKMILRRCKERVGLLEDAEKSRLQECQVCQPTDVTSP